MAKSVKLAYFLWLFFGWTGLHHVYLRRDRQAFLWWASVSGFFGCGWFTDSWMIPSYVQDANHDPRFVKKLISKIQKHPQKPPFSSTRFIVEVVAGNLFGQVVSLAIPEELDGIIYSLLIHLLVPFAVALGVHTAGNIGRQEGSLYWPVVATYMFLPIILAYDKWLFWGSMSAAVAFNWKSKKWQQTPPERDSLTRRLLILMSCTFMWSCLLLSGIYFNAYFVDEMGEPIKVHVALSHFFASPLWMEFMASMSEIYEHAFKDGFNKAWEELVNKLDPLGEKSALKVLGLTTDATEEEITAQYRKLSREWHPDRHKDPKAKAAAQESFMSIQEAVERLSSIKGRRLRRTPG